MDWGARPIDTGPIVTGQALAEVPATGRGPSLLMDLRPCYEGFAGIPQEARLLFALFAEMGLPRLGGLASGIHFISRRRDRQQPRTSYRQVMRQTQSLITQDTRRHYAPIGMRLAPLLKRRAAAFYAIAAYAGRSEALDLQIDPAVFEDYLWTKLFERTLPPAARPLLRRAEYFATELGHENARHLCFLPSMFQRRVDTRGWDVFLGCTVSPYRVSPETAMVIRYYDPLPLLSPHTVGEPWQHALSHGRMLERNMRQGASFVCDSEPIREEVLHLFPEAERRVHTIPCVIAPEYQPDVRSESELRTVLRRRASPATRPDPKGGVTRPNEPAKLPRLIMAVSTLEPRKNYLRLFRAFEMARRRVHEPMQLLIVANPGWRSEQELAELKLLVLEGAYHLAGVPLTELRMLYSMAHLVVAPSRAEGFDYSGVEAMACGTPVLASDTPVHRWVYGDAAEYADPYDEEQFADRLAALGDLPRQEGHLAGMRERGLRRASLYRADVLSGRWHGLLSDVAAGHARTPAGA